MLSILIVVASFEANWFFENLSGFDQIWWQASWVWFELACSKSLQLLTSLTLSLNGSTTMVDNLCPSIMLDNDSHDCYGSCRLVTCYFVSTFGAACLHRNCFANDEKTAASAHPKKRRGYVGDSTLAAQNANSGLFSWYYTGWLVFPNWLDRCNAGSKAHIPPSHCPKNTQNDYQRGFFSVVLRWRWRWQRQWNRRSTSRGE